MIRFTRIPFLFCVGGVFALHARSMLFSFVGLDDAAYTFRNPFVAGGLSAGNVAEAFTNLRHGGIWMPVTYISYMLDASLCRWTGLPLIGEMHFINVCLHTVNFLLLWKLLSLIFTWGTGNGEWGMGDGEEETRNSKLGTLNSQLPTLIPALAAMTWAVHPLRAEPVAWIAARKELLWALFTLAGLICWIKGNGEEGTGNGEEGTGNGERGMGNGERSSKPETPNSTCSTCSTRLNSKLQTLNSRLATLVFCILACLSKPTAMCFPFLLLLVAWRKPKAERSASAVWLLPVMFIIAAATALIAAYSQTHVAGHADTALFTVPFAHRIVNAMSAIGFYIRATFWPFGLHIDCRAVPGLWPIDAGWNFLALALAMTAVITYLLLSRKQSTHPPLPIPSSLFPITFPLAWFLLSIAPTLGLFGNFGMEAHADRFAYLPSMGIAFLIAGSARLNSKLLTLNSKLLTLIVIVLLSFVTFQQLSYWRDDWAAHQRVLDCDPGHPRAMVHVADARCSRKRDFDGGIALYRKALSLADSVPPGGFDGADVKSRLAYALASRGRYEDYVEVKRIGADVLRDTSLDRRGMMLDALGTAFMADCDFRRAAVLFKASIDAPDRFWPKASTRRKFEECMRRK